MKLNLGCGHRRRDDYVNVDMFEACRPDVLWDLEQLPWPWESSSADEVLFHHSMEHLGPVSYTHLTRSVRTTS